jgi:hypothetical protein
MRFFSAAVTFAMVTACAPRWSAAPAPPNEPPRAAPAWSPPTTDPSPSGAVVRAACGPIAAAFEDPRLHSFEDARALLFDLATNPPDGMPKEQVAWCTEQIARLIAGQVSNEANIEAYRAIARIAKALRAAYATRKSLCPAAAPVPSALPEPNATYQSTILDWTNDPGWSCIRFVTEDPQRFQYEVTVAGDAFAIRARRRLEGAVVLVTLEGRVDAGEIAFAPNVVESRTPIH